jgi:hypothetical protein
MEDWFWYALGGVGLLGVGAFVFLYERKKVSASAISGTGIVTNATQQAAIIQATTQSASIASGQTGLSESEQSTNALETGVATSLNAVPIAGPALSAIANAFLTGHIAREKAAVSENQAVNSLIPAFDSDLKSVFAAMNAGDLTPSEGVQAVTIIWNNYWTGIKPVQQGSNKTITPLSTLETGNVAGVNGGSFGIMCNSQAAPGGIPCDKTCTAGCCVGNDVLTPSIQQAIACFSSPTGGTINVCKVYGNSTYGTTTRNAYNLTYTPPKATPLSVAHLV